MTHQQMLDAVTECEAAWRAVRLHYWRGKSIREAVRLSYSEMKARQEGEPWLTRSESA